jgi:hypothetical protein
MNTEIGWKSRTGSKDNGAAILGEGTQIKASVEFKRKLVRNTKGEQVISEATICTTQAVTTGDILTIDGRDWTVIMSDPVRGLGGSVLYYEVNL